MCTYRSYIHKAACTHLSANSNNECVLYIVSYKISYCVQSYLDGSLRDNFLNACLTFLFTVWNCITKGRLANGRNPTNKNMMTSSAGVTSASRSCLKL